MPPAEIGEGGISSRRDIRGHDRNAGSRPRREFGNWPEGIFGSAECLYTYVEVDWLCLQSIRSLWNGPQTPQHGKTRILTPGLYA